MNPATKLGLALLGAAAALGVLGDALLRATPWGLNVFLWIGPLVAAGALLARAHGLPLTGGGRWLIAPALFFAAALAWRDSPTLNWLNLSALLAALALVTLRARAGRVLVAGVLEHAQGFAVAAVGWMIGLFDLVTGDIRWKDMPRRTWSKQAGAAGRGLAIALPLLFVFGSLFAAADAVFEDFVVRLFDWDVDELVTRTVLISFWTILAGGFLRQTLMARQWTASRLDRPASISLGGVEIGVALGLLNALFLAFVVVQVRYLFGGAGVVESSIHLTYAEYARRGFFDLVAVAALVLPALLIVHWLLPEGDATAQRLFRVLAGALIALLFVVMLSAVQRMLLYQREFGLTELRVYTTAFMGWLAIVFLWFVASVLRGRRERFAFGALAAGFAVILALHALNHDDLIARVNTNRPDAPNPFDARYVAALSADAVPALVEALPSMNESDRCLVAGRLLARWSPPANPDWRTWSFSRAQAWATVEANRVYLQSVACYNR